MKLAAKLGKLERVAGIGGPCEACELAADFDARLGELMREWGIPPPAQGGRIRSSCTWCARVTYFPAAGYTPGEVAAFERTDALYWRGELCLPEYDRLGKIVQATEPRMLRERFGGHADEVLRLKDKYREACDRLREMRAATAYLCCVPGCTCEFPKTLDEWRERVEARGYAVRGFPSRRAKIEAPNRRARAPTGLASFD